MSSNEIKFIAQSWERVKNQYTELSRQTQSKPNGRLSGPVRYCDKRAYYPVSKI